MKFWKSAIGLYDSCSKAKKVTVAAGLGFLVSSCILALGMRSPKDAPRPAGLGKTVLSDGNTLGLNFEKLPSLSLRPMSFDDIAKKIGIKDAEKAKKEALALADRVRGGYLPSGWKDDCPEEYSAEFCTIVDDYLGPKKAAMLNAASRPARSVRLPFTKRYIGKLQVEDLPIQLRRAPDWTFSQMKALGELSMKVTSCPRNLSLTIARKLDVHLNQKGAWELMDRLDAHGLECLQKDDPWAEMIYQRVALYRIARNMNAEALPLLERALEAETKREENRTLYWLAFAREKRGMVKEAQAAREALWKAYPLAWHTLVSRVRAGFDPLKLVMASDNYSDDFSSGDERLDRRALWLQLMMQSDVLPFSVRHYGEFVVKTFTPSIRPGFVQHLARIFNNNGLHRLQILLLSQMISSKPDAVNVEVLRLLYPRPYFEELKAEGKLDTAILLGLARQESGFDPSAVSSANARGLLQLLPSTARSLKGSKGKKLHDYSDNIALGSQFLVKLARGLDGSIERTLAAYNAGGTIVRKWMSRYDFAKDFEDPMLLMDLIPYRETRDYVPSILRNAYWYHRLFPELTEKLGPEVFSSEFLQSVLPPR